METKQSLSHETAKIPQLSIETQKRFIELLNSLFGENKATDKDYENTYWQLLKSSMCDNYLQDFNKQNFVEETKQNIESVQVLYSIFKELQTN